MALIEDVIHAAGQTDVFGDVPGRAQAEDAVGANLVLLAAGDRLTLVVVLLRLLLAVPGEGRLQRNVIANLPAQGGVQRVFRDNRQTIAGLFVLTLQHIGDVVGPVDGLAHRNVQRPLQTFHHRFRHVFPLVEIGTFIVLIDRGIARFNLVAVVVAEPGDARQPAVAFKLEANLFVDAGLGF